MADQARQVAEAQRQIRDALGLALLDACPWCTTGLTKVANPPFCPSCHRDMLAWTQELQEERESQRKGVRASNKVDIKARETELLRRMRAEGVLNKPRSKRATNRE